MSIDDLVRVMARRCGLQDPDAWETDPDRCWWESGSIPSGWLTPDEKAKGSGRTTRMLLKALIALEVGATVEIVVADQDQVPEMRGRIAALCSAAGIPDRLHRSNLHHGWPGALVLDVPKADVRLVDHAVAVESAPC